MLAEILRVIEKLLGVEGGISVHLLPDSGTHGIGEAVHAVGGVRVPETGTGGVGLAVAEVDLESEILEE
jgi:hypothetical protein